MLRLTHWVTFSLQRESFKTCDVFNVRFVSGMVVEIPSAST